MSDTTTSRTQTWIAKQFPPANRPHLKQFHRVRAITEQVTHSHPCGCKIVEAESDHELKKELRIEYCSTHLQAFALKTQVRNLLTRAATDTDGTIRREATITLNLCDASGAQ